MLLVGFQAQGTLGRFLVTAPRPSASRAMRSRSRRGSAVSTTIPDTRTDRNWRAGSPRAADRRGRFLVHGEEPAIAGLAERIAERIIPAARVFLPVLDDIYELSAAAPMRSTRRRRRLAPRPWSALDWHNDMSKLILDINDRIEAAADDRARGVIIRRLRRALEE